MIIAKLQKQTVFKKAVFLFKKNFEGFVLLFFLALWFYMVKLRNMPIVLPSFGGALGILFYYVSPLIIAAFIQFFVLILFSLLKKSTWGLNAQETLSALTYIPYVFVVLILYFNFKAWMPLINPTTYDALYYKIDNLTPIVEWFSGIGKAIDFNNICSKLYFLVYVAMFICSFTFHAMFDNFVNFRKVVVGTCVVLLLGGISYWIMPAVGPFIFRNSVLSGFSDYQRGMYLGFLSLAKTGIVPASYFGAAPAAMPSLHAANSVFFLLSAKRSLPALSVIYIPVALFILVVAVASGWHYLIDLPVGILLAMLALWIVDKVYDIG